MKKQFTSVAIAALLLTGSHYSHAQTASGVMVATDVKPGDWAYDAVQDLASKGLIQGYPPDGNFLGSRSLTRYEMATIISRVLAKLDDLAAQPGTNTESIQAQIDEAKKLADDYKVELTVIGTRMDKAEADIAQLQSDVSAQKAGLSSAYDAIEEQAKRTDALKKTVGTKVGSADGAVSLDGLIQFWGLSGKDVTAYPGGGASGISNSFKLRRAEITLTGKITPEAYFKAQIDPAKQLAATTTATYSAGKSGLSSASTTSITQSSNILQDLYVGYKLEPTLAVELGQQKIPLSMEGFRSSASLYTIDRTLFNEAPYANGRVGDIRDTGILVRASTTNSTAATAAPTFVKDGHAPVAEAALGVFDNSGQDQNTTDDNNRKDFIYHADYRPSPKWYVGVYQDASGGENGNLNTRRDRVGGELSTTFFGKNNLIEGEFEKARDAAIKAASTTLTVTTVGGVTTITPVTTPASVLNPRLRSEGAYLLYVRTLSDKVQFALREDYFNPNTDLHGDTIKNDEYDLVAGPTFILGKTGNNTTQIQFNYVHKDINGPKNGTGKIAGTGSGNTFLGAPRDLYIVNFQQAF